MSNGSDIFADIIVQVFDHGSHRIPLKYLHPVKAFLDAQFRFFQRKDCIDGPVEAVESGFTGNRYLPSRILYAVSPKARAASFSFCGLAFAAPYSGMDLVMEAQWSIVNARMFLERIGAGLAYPSAPLRRLPVESWINNFLRGWIERRLGEGEWEGEKTPFAAPLADFGVQLDVERVIFEPADPVRAKLQKQRQEDFVRIEYEKDLVQNALLRRRQILQNGEAEKRRLEKSADREGQELAAELEKVERARCRDLLLAEIKIVSSRLAWNKVLLQHETAMSRVANNADGVKKAMSKLYEVEREHRKTMAFFTQAQNMLSKIARIPAPILSVLAGRDRVAAHQAAERLTSSEFGLGADGLIALGYDVLPQAMLQFLRRKNMADGEAVRMKVPQSRDVGTAALRTLRVNAPIRFDFFTQRAGYVTVLNIGTSGRVSVQVPNGYVEAQSARVKADSQYTLPGEELLPAEKMKAAGLQYCETGPAGWEHMVVVVSDEPLIGMEILKRATEAAAFVLLSDGEFDELCVKLNAMPPQQWTANFLSFLVVGEGEQAS